MFIVVIQVYANVYVIAYYVDTAFPPASPVRGL